MLKKVIKGGILVSAIAAGGYIGYKLAEIRPWLNNKEYCEFCMDRLDNACEIAGGKVLNVEGKKAKEIYEELTGEEELPECLKPKKTQTKPQKSVEQKKVVQKKEQAKKDAVQQNK